MKSKQDSVKKIEQLLVMETAGKTFTTKLQQLAYERGYLTGLLATMALTDLSVEHMLTQRIQQLSHKIL